MKLALDERELLFAAGGGHARQNFCVRIVSTVRERAGTSVQKVDYAKLRERLLATVVIMDTATNGYVVIDAVQLMLVK